jgi:hypothetical protein
LVGKTKEMSNASDAEWEQHYDALMNLRVLNRFHFSVLQADLIVADEGKWIGAFIASQVKNLRSHNSRNAMELFYELFNYNDSHQ